MFITLKSIKRNLGLFNLEVSDIIIGTIFVVLFIITFLLKFYTLAIVIIAIGILSLVPVDFSKANRMYRLFLIFIKFMVKDKVYYFYRN